MSHINIILYTFYIVFVYNPQAFQYTINVFMICIIFSRVIEEVTCVANIKRTSLCRGFGTI